MILNDFEQLPFFIVADESIFVLKWKSQPFLHNRVICSSNKLTNKFQAVSKKNKSL